MEVREAEGVVVTEVMGVAMVVMVVVLVVMAGAMVVMVVMVVMGVVRVEQSCVARSRCNLSPEGRMSTPNQGHRRHRRRCWWSNSSCRNSYTMSSRSSIVSMSHSCNNK